jgi:outer membrane protein TolC
LAAALLAGCTAAAYRRSADKEVYGTISEKTPLVPNMEPRFTLEHTNQALLDGLPVVTQTNEFLGPQEAARELGAPILSLQASLDLAVQHSRPYQNAREQLYLTALTLTLSRHQFAPLFSASGSGTYNVQTEQTVALVPDPITGQPTPVLSDNLAENRSFRAQGSVGVSWLIRDLGRISAALTTDFLRFVSGDPRTLTSSAVGATLSRPLLRNAGFKAEVENLTQDERDLLYGVRDFVRYRKDFSVQIAAAYYGVLSSRDAARNAFLNLESSRKSADRTRALAAEGRSKQTDLGRIEQQELSAESSWIAAVRAYLRALDDFKIQMGIPVDTCLVLDDHELASLKIDHPTLRVEDSITVALAARLDYQNVRDQKDDSTRKVSLARDRLKGQLDLTANAALASKQQSSGFAVPDVQRYSYSAGLNLDLPLERKAERNAYRATLISEQRAIRAVEQSRDDIESQVRESWRTLEQAKRTYEISEVGVKVAERRVEEQELLAEFGRAQALDEVDAQNALVSSKDQRTQALVAHTIARLQFWNNMGILYIKENGQWENLSEPTVTQTKPPAGKAHRPQTPAKSYSSVNQRSETIQ